MKAGDYQGQAVKGSVQYGETDKGTLQIGIDMKLFDEKGEEVGQMTTVLYFSDGAAVYSYERLRMMGWKGEGADQIDKLDEIFETKVPVRVTAPEPYTAADGSTKMGSAKLEIVTGGGRLEFQKTVEMDTFKARLKAISGSTAPSGGSSGNGTEGKGPTPPF